MRVLGVLAVLGLLTVVGLVAFRRDRASAAVHDEERAEDHDETQSIAPIAAESSRTAVGEEAAGEDPFASAVPLDDLDLIAQAIHVSHATRTNDPLKISQAAIPIIYEHGNVLRAMQIIRGAKLEQLVAAYVEHLPAPERPSREDALWDAEIGIACTLVFAIVKHNNPEVPAVLFHGAPVDGHAFTVEVLRLLPSFNERARKRLLALLTRVTTEDGALWVGPEYFRDVLTLRELDPENAELYSALLSKMGLAMDAQQALVELSPLLEDPTDPAYADAIRGLLVHEELRGIALATAKADYDRVPAETRHALASAIAMHDEPKDAVDFLTPRLGNVRFSALRGLYSREGGGEALVEKYDELLAADQDPEARAALVTGITDGDEVRTLDHVLASDPSARVRTAALLTYINFADGEVSSAAMAALENGVLNYKHPQQGLSPSGSVACLNNILMESRDKQKRATAVNLLMQIAATQDHEVWVREKAVTTLERRSSLSPEEIEALRASFP